MKKRIARPEPLELSVENMEGKTIELRVDAITSDMLDEVRKSATDESEKTGSKLCYQVSILFGNTPKFYEQFDIVTLLGIVQAFNEYSVTPTKTQGN